MEEKRYYHRVPFQSHSKVHILGQTYPCELLDISLRGILIKFEQETEIALGSLCQIDIALVSCDIHLKIDAELVHREGNHYGFRIEALDLDSLTHLRRLLELNYGDADEINREFFHWLKKNE